MKNLDFEWLTDEFMLYRRGTQENKKKSRNTALFSFLFLFCIFGFAIPAGMLYT